MVLSICFRFQSVVAYLRSVYMMRNKKVFDVASVDAGALAASYGLVIVPRVRFLSKKGISVKVECLALRRTRL